MTEKFKDKKYIIAIDHGTSGMKVALISTDGEVIDWVFREVELILPGPGAAEQDPQEWWDKFISASKELLEKNQKYVKEIVGISNTSQWSGTVPLDKNGDPLMNCIIWMDTRGAKYMKAFHKSLLQVSGYSLFKILKWVKITGGGPTLSGKDPIGHILWLKNEHPEIYEQTDMFLEPQDYINYRLTGKYGSSYATIHMHWLTDIRDVENIDYSDKLIKKMKLDRNKFPQDLGWSTDVLGPIKREVAEELGLAEDVKVVRGAPDLHAASIGSGAVLEYEGHFCIGTSDWLICHVPEKKTDIFHNMASAPAAIEEKYMIINEQEIAGGALTFLRDKILYHKDELLQESIIHELSKLNAQILEELKYRNDIPENHREIIKEKCIYYRDLIKSREDVKNIYAILDEIMKVIEEEEKETEYSLEFLRKKFAWYKKTLMRGDPLQKIYKLFDEMVESVPPGANKMIFTPWLFGERSPVDDHSIRGGLYNISLDMTRSDMVRAIFEGVAYNVKWLLYYVEKFIEKWVKEFKPEQIEDGKIMPELTIIGGGANSDVWCQIFADILDRRVKQLEDPIQANSLGAAYIASVGLGYIDWKDVANNVKYKNIYEPNPENRDLYDRLYEEFLNIYKETRKIYKRINEYE
ncbi:MAG: hypothetical protein EU544_03845 [Promethearchaeota archaeon]|nr:MAG: hypothetical protein EU544_03845 [Candidatus Lokiarchaeota archaeon]